MRVVWMSDIGIVCFFCHQFWSLSLSHSYLTYTGTHKKNTKLLKSRLFMSMAIIPLFAPNHQLTYLQPENDQRKWHVLVFDRNKSRWEGANVPCWYQANWELDLKVAPAAKSLWQLGRNRWNIQKKTLILRRRNTSERLVEDLRYLGHSLWPFDGVKRLPKQKEKSIGFNNHANQRPSKQHNDNSTEKTQRRLYFLSLHEKPECSF